MLEMKTNKEGVIVIIKDDKEIFNSNNSIKQRNVSDNQGLENMELVHKFLEI